MLNLTNYSMKCKLNNKNTFLTYQIGKDSKMWQEYEETDILIYIVVWSTWQHLLIFKCTICLNSTIPLLGISLQIKAHMCAKINEQTWNCICFNVRQLNILKFHTVIQQMMSIKVSYEVFMCQTYILFSQKFYWVGVTVQIRPAVQADGFIFKKVPRSQPDHIEQCLGVGLEFNIWDQIQCFNISAT